VYSYEWHMSVSVFYWVADVSKYIWLNPRGHSHILIMLVILIIIVYNNMIDDTGAKLGFPYCEHFKRSKTLLFCPHNIFACSILFSERRFLFTKQHKQICLHIAGPVFPLRGRNWNFEKHLNDFHASNDLTTLRYPLNRGSSGNSTLSIFIWH